MRWRFWQSRREEGRVACEVPRWEVEMARAGWYCWQYFPPPYWLRTRMVEVKRREWPTIAIWSLDSIDPATNIAGLWWKPLRPETAIGDTGGIIELTKTPLGHV